MGYLQLSAGIADFSKAVISFWVRVPSATFDIMTAISDSFPSGGVGDHMCSACYYPPLFKYIPLLTFGSVESDSDGNACQPSFIGIDCWGGANKLTVNLQTTTALSFSSSNMSFDPVARPACFFMGGSDGGPVISADTWHHVLVSFDISGSSSLTQANPGPYTVSSGSTFTWALDDVRNVDSTISPSGGGSGQLNGMSDPSAIAPQLFDYDGGQDGDIVSCGGCHIQSSGQPIGIPSSAAFTDKVQLVEMAELQIFTGVSADAGDVLIRRLFVTGTGTPASRTLPQAEFGQAPDVCIAGSSANWIAGSNSGTAGNFVPTGTVTAYAAPSL